MNDVIIPTKEQIDRLQEVMSTMPQMELQTEHFFSGGMYCRKLTRPAGTVIVGKVHKEPPALRGWRLFGFQVVMRQGGR